MGLKKRGFTLLEAMLAVFILSAGVIAVISACNAIALSSGDAEDAKLAADIARAKMAEIVSLPFTSIDNADPAFSQAPDATFTKFTVDANTTGTNPKQINVVVTWNTKDGQTSLTITTLMAQT